LGYSALVGLGVSFSNLKFVEDRFSKNKFLGADNWFSIANYSDRDYHQTTQEGCKNHRQTSQVDNGGASGHSFDQDVWLGSFLLPADQQLSRKRDQNGSKIFVRLILCAIIHVHNNIFSSFAVAWLVGLFSFLPVLASTLSFVSPYRAFLGLF
jgi:hypothetical protein